MICIAVRGNTADQSNAIVRADMMPPVNLAGNHAGSPVVRRIAGPQIEGSSTHNKFVGIIMRRASILFALVLRAPPWFVQRMLPFINLTISQTKNESQA